MNTTNHDLRLAARREYQKKYQRLKVAFWQVSPDDPDFKLSWAAYRAKHLPPPSVVRATERGPYTDPSTWTAAQAYQAVYQKGRHKAEKDYFNRPEVRMAHTTFSEYWKAMRQSYLPEGFLKGRAPALTPKRPLKDGRSKELEYQRVYRKQRRAYLASPLAQKQWTWEDYWEQSKRNIFDGYADGKPPLRPLAHEVLEQERIQREQAAALSDSPITRATQQPVAVVLFPDDEASNDDNQGWIAAA